MFPSAVWLFSFRKRSIAIVKKLHAILKILIHMGGRGSVYIKAPFTKGIRSGFVAGKSTKLISH